MTEYACVISAEREDCNSFCVTLLVVPEFPSDLPAKPGVHRPAFAVIGANDDGGAWGFVSLDEEQKTCVGNALVALSAETQKWYYCNLFRRQPEEPQQANEEEHF